MILILFYVMCDIQYFVDNFNLLESSKRLDKVLVLLTPKYSRSQIKKMIINCKIKVNEYIVTKPGHILRKGDIIKVDLSYNYKSCNIPLQCSLNIIYEDDYILVVNKPSNLVVHPGYGNLNNTLLDLLLFYYPPISSVPRAGIIHRLDKDTTGLMVIAKNIDIRNKLIKLFKEGQIIREYEGIVNGIIDSSGTIEQPIGRHIVNRTYMTVDFRGKMAITHYNILEKFKLHTRVGFRLETGRTHQIRVHMNYIHHPLVGDQKYGNHLNVIKMIDRSSVLFNNNYLYQFNRQALHAIKLCLFHPITHDALCFHAPVPQDMLDLINLLRLDFRENIL